MPLFSNFFKFGSNSAKNELKVDFKNMPTHIAIIMDGNGRWAEKRGLPRAAGHRAGSQNLKRLVEYCNEIGLKYLTVYAFSTENWSRPSDEVNQLMNLLVEYLKEYRKEAEQKNIRMNIIGDITALSSEIQNEIIEIQNITKNKTGLVLNIALNYGGRSEIVKAFRELCKDVEAGKLKAGDIDEEKISSRLFTSGMPDPDLIIRPSGEQRLSNFLLWQSAYAEFWYADICWPDFNREHLLKAIADYQNRSRRFGGI